MDGAGWKNAPASASASAAMEGVAGLRPVPLSLSLSVSPASYCEFTRSRSLVDAIFVSISEITLAVWGSPSHSMD